MKAVLPVIDLTDTRPLRHSLWEPAVVWESCRWDSTSRPSLAYLAPELLLVPHGRVPRQLQLPASRCLVSELTLQGQDLVVEATDTQPGVFLGSLGP